jgi:hypothetical protein
MWKVTTLSQVQHQVWLRAHLETMLWGLGLQMWDTILAIQNQPPLPPANLGNNSPAWWGISEPADIPAI